MSEHSFDTTPRPLALAKLPEHRNSDTPLGATQQGHFPLHLHRAVPQGGALFETAKEIKKHRHATVCEEAKCPNRLECWSKKTATFLLLGKECTRSCGFCDINFSKEPKPPEADEPERIAVSVERLGLRHVVLTMVARDDLPDQGAFHITECIRQIRQRTPSVTIEVLTSDFSGDVGCIDTVLSARPDVFNHNIETVERLTPRVRHKAQYRRTLSVLSHAKRSGAVSYIKSGLMVGLGEESQEVFQTLRDLQEAGCDIVTIGHYLQAAPSRLKVSRFVSNEEFLEYEKFGKSIGLKEIYSGPFVRSSYNAAEVFTTVQAHG